jgi:ABC-type tungstate transport system substrate-binding protein
VPKRSCYDVTGEATESGAVASLLIEFDLDEIDLGELAPIVALSLEVSVSATALAVLIGVPATGFILTDRERS